MVKFFKLFFLLLSLDLKQLFLNIVGRVRYSYARWRARWHETVYQKVFEEKNSVACFLYTPILVYRMIEDTLVAWCRGETYEEYMNKKIEKIRKEGRVAVEKSEALKTEIHVIQTANMNKFANLFPGATIQDFEHFTKIRFLSLRLLYSFVKAAGKRVFTKLFVWKKH